MNTTLLIAMIISGIGAVWGISRQKAGCAWGRPVALLCAICAVAAAGWRMVGLSSFPNPADLLRNELRYEQAAAWKLGNHLASTCPGAKALVIVEPQLIPPGAAQNETAAKTDRQENILDGLREGFGDKVELVKAIAPEIPPHVKQFMEDAPGTSPEDAPEPMFIPLEEWFTAKTFDQLIKKHAKECDLVISTIGLPQDLGRMAFWTMKKRPKLALTGGSVYNLRQALETGAVIGAITYDPSKTYDDDPPPKDLGAAFQKRYLLLTPKNTKSIAQQHASLFATSM